MKKKLRLLAAFACNLAILALEARTILPLWDWGTLPFYTQDSNLFAAAACALAAVLQLRSLLNGKAFPRWARLLKYMAACCLTLTMLVVTLVLAPVYLGADGYRQLLLEEPALSLHLLCPLLTLASFLLFETEPALPRRAVALAVLPTLVYGAALGCLNGLGMVDGPYPFLRVHAQPPLASALWALAISGGAALIAWLIRLCADQKNFSLPGKN